MAERRKVTAAFAAFSNELSRLRRLDDINQEKFFPGPGRPGADRLSSSQMHLLTEAIFARGFSNYELFMEEVFILYCRGRKSASGRSVKAFVSPKSYEHTRSLLKSGMAFLEWNSPEKIIERSKIYLDTDNPVYLAVTTHQTRLSRMRRIRNAIAHATSEAESLFRRTVRDELGVAPLRPPSVGEFLIMPDRLARVPQYYLKSYFDVLSDVASVAAN